MSLLTDPSVVALTTDSSSVTKDTPTGHSTLPTAIFPSSATKISEVGSEDSSTQNPTTITSSFYSNLEMLTDTSSIAALASSAASDDSGSGDSTSISASTGNSNSSSSNSGGGLDADTNKSPNSSSSKSGAVASISSTGTSDGSSIIFNHYNQQDKLNWKLIIIPLMLVLPFVL